MPIPAIILAAGASRRLGQPKQLVLVNGETLLTRSMRMAREAGADPVFVVLGGNQVSIEAAIDFTPVIRISNANWEKGIATSIRMGVEAVRNVCPESEAALMLACDQPLLTADHLRALIEKQRRIGAPSIVASRYNAITGIPAIFSAAYFSELQGLHGDSGARQILRAHEKDVAWVEFAGGEFDIDSPADLALLVSGGSSGSVEEN